MEMKLIFQKFRTIMKRACFKINVFADVWSVAGTRSLARIGFHAVPADSQVIR